MKMNEEKDIIVEQCQLRLQPLIDLMNQSKDYCAYFCYLFIPIGFVICSMYFKSILIGYVMGLCIIYLLSRYICRLVLKLPDNLITPVAIMMIAFSWRQKLQQPSTAVYDALYDKVFSDKQDDKPRSNSMLIDGMINAYIKSLMKKYSM